MVNRFLSIERNFQSALKKERILPLQIGWKLTVETIDAFFERHETLGCKFDIDSKGNVFIVEMKGAEHASVIEQLTIYFNVPNGGLIKPPMNIMINPAHYRLRGRKPSAPDIAIYPGLNIIPKPPIPQGTYRYREIPPVDKSGRPHARIICEIAISQSFKDWNKKCRRWMRQQYVRCVFGIKIYSARATRNTSGQLDRCMIARLWTRQTTPSPKHTADQSHPGVYYEEWNFGTLDYHTGAPTACTGPDLSTYQVNIPVKEVFWNPPIVGGAPSTVGYVITVPGGITALDFVIDLYQIQQVVLQNQDN